MVMNVQPKQPPDPDVLLTKDITYSLKLPIDYILKNDDINLPILMSKVSMAHKIKTHGLNFIKENCQLNNR